jgi:hypothetical protein
VQRQKENENPFAEGSSIEVYSMNNFDDHDLPNDLEANIPLTDSFSPPPPTVASAAVITASNHPTATFFHLCFKAGAIVIYILNPADYVMVFVAVVLLLAFDFWTVKNVTGRLLVGLRWSNKIKV